MRLFLDTNFVIDLLLREEYKDMARNFLASASKQGCEFYISYLSIANFAYVARKIEKSLLCGYIVDLCELFHIVGNDDKQIQYAIQLNADDFEDALQYTAASSVDCDCIITRNQKDFDFAKIPVMSPMEYSERYL